jgi:addiction module HigA family antidote
MTTKIGDGILRGLREALAHAQGAADESQYRVHVFPRRESIPRKVGRLMSPLHPGEMLREDFLNPLRMTAQMLASEIKVPERRLVAIVKEKQGLDADLCLRLARFFRMTPEFWMNMQKAYELETVRSNWRMICREVPMHPKDRKTGALKVPKISV